MKTVRRGIPPILCLAVIVVAGLVQERGDAQTSSRNPLSEADDTAAETPARRPARQTRQIVDREAEVKVTRVLAGRGQNAKQIQQMLQPVLPDSVTIGVSNGNQLILSGPIELLDSLDELIGQLLQTRPVQTPYVRPLATIEPPVASYPTTNPYAVQQVPRDPAVDSLTNQYNHLESELLALVKTHRDSDSPGEQNELRKKICEMTSRQFDLRQQVRELEVKRLRSRLDEVESSVRSRLELKDKIVDKRVTEVLDEDKELKWEPLRKETRIVTPQYPGPENVVDGLQSDDGRMVPSQQATPAARPRPAITQPSTSYAPTSTLDREPIAGRLAVVEAEKRLTLAEEALQQTKKLFEKGYITESELATKRSTVEFARLALDRSRQEYEARTKLLELALREAQTEVEGLRHRITSSGTSVNERVKIQSQIEKAMLQVELAKILLDLHLQNAKEEGETPGDPSDLDAAPSR